MGRPKGDFRFFWIGFVPGPLLRASPDRSSRCRGTVVYAIDGACSNWRVGIPSLEGTKVPFGMTKAVIQMQNASRRVRFNVTTYVGTMLIRANAELLAGC